MSNIFLRVSSLNKFHQFLLLQSQISLSNLLRTPTSGLEVILNESFRKIKHATLQWIEELVGKQNEQYQLEQKNDKNILNHKEFYINQIIDRMNQIKTWNNFDNSIINSLENFLDTLILNEKKSFIEIILNEKHLPRKEVCHIVQTVSYHFRVPVRRDLGSIIANEFQIRDSEIDFKTSLPMLDTHLGGIVRGILTELVGPAGVGKSQFSMTLALEKLAQLLIKRDKIISSNKEIQNDNESNLILSQMNTQNLDNYENQNNIDNADNEVSQLIGDFENPENPENLEHSTILYIDTESIDIEPRIKQIASQRFTDPKLRDEVLKSLNQINIIRFTSSQEMTTFFKDELETYLLENQVKMVILDSIAYLIRKEFVGTSKLVERQSVLLEYASKLKELSSSLHIPIVITNHAIIGEHASFNFSDGKRKRDQEGVDSRSGQETTLLKAALGNTWSHCINTRLILQEPEQGIKQVIIDKSISSGRKTIRYYIGAGGIFQHEKQDDINHFTLPNTIHSRLHAFNDQDTNQPRKRARLYET